MAYDVFNLYLKRLGQMWIADTTPQASGLIYDLQLPVHSNSVVLLVVEPDLSSARYRCALPNIQIGNENLNRGYAIAQFLLNIPSIAS